MAASTGTTLTNSLYVTLDSRIPGLASQMVTNQAKNDQQIQLHLQQEQFNSIITTLQNLTKKWTTNRSNRKPAI